MISCKAAKAHIRCPVKYAVLIWVCHSLRPVLLRFDVFEDVNTSQVVSLSGRLSLCWRDCLLSFFACNRRVLSILLLASPTLLSQINLAITLVGLL
jgi:hypothetical protein